MNIIRPTEVSDAILVSSTVPDVDNIGTSATSLLIEIASKTFTTQADLGFVAGEWVTAASAANPANYMYGKITSYSGTSLVVNMTVNGGSGTYSDWIISYGYNAAATYLIDDQVQVSTPNIHRIYKSLQNANIGNALPVLPATETAWWKEIGATNRWKAFDEKVGSQASRAASMNFVFEPGIVDSIAILNLDATKVDIVMTDPVDGEVYNESIDLISTINVTDWYKYYFEPIIRAVDLVRSDLAEVNLPPYLNAELSVTITNAGGTAKCGEIVFGLKSEIGSLFYDHAVGITDYSTKAADDEGNYKVIERPYSRRLEGLLRIKNTIKDEIFRQLALYHATPLVWIGSQEHACEIVYGFYKHFRFIERNNTHSEVELEVEGLT